MTTKDNIIGEDPETVDTNTIFQKADKTSLKKRLLLKGKYLVDFDPQAGILFRK